MSRIAGVIRSGLRTTTFTFRRRLLLAAVLALVVAIPSYAMILSNTTQHVVTIQDVTITVSPSTDYALASGNTESGTVTVSTPQTFDGMLTISITNTTVTQGPPVMNAASFTVTIDSVPATGIGLPSSTTLAYVSGQTTIADGHIFHYTITFLSKSEDLVNGIANGSTYDIQQVVSE